MWLRERDQVTKQLDLDRNEKKSADCLTEVFKRDLGGVMQSMVYIMTEIFILG